MDYLWYGVEIVLLVLLIIGLVAGRRLLGLSQLLDLMENAIEDAYNVLPFQEILVDSAIVRIITKGGARVEAFFHSGPFSNPHTIITNQDEIHEERWKMALSFLLIKQMEARKLVKLRYPDMTPGELGNHWKEIEELPPMFKRYYSWWYVARVTGCWIGSPGQGFQVPPPTLNIPTAQKLPWKGPGKKKEEVSKWRPRFAYS